MYKYSDIMYSRTYVMIVAGLLKHGFEKEDLYIIMTYKLRDNKSIEWCDGFG